jgi:hypothetical protein
MRRRRLDRNCWLIEPSSIFHGRITSVGVGSPAKQSNETRAQTLKCQVDYVRLRWGRGGGEDGKRE